MKDKLSLVLIVLLIIVGFSSALYPIVSNWQNQRLQERMIKTYEETTSNIDTTKLEEEKSKARDYNRKLYENGVVLSDPFDEKRYIADAQTYLELLDLSGDGVMCYIEIPKISLTLPVYHTTDADVLQQGIGHLEGSSLPVGGETTHSVLSGHRGLPSAKLFTDLDQMQEGDRFYIHMLNETLAYEVDNITVCEPDDVSELKIKKGEDYVTLVTCTPYSINSHRLLVRGHRTEYVKETENRTDVTLAGVIKIHLYELAVLSVFVITVIVIITILVRSDRKRRKR